MTTLTPPPAGPAGYGPRPVPVGPPTGPRSSARTVAILAIVLGALLVLGTIVSVTLSTLRAAAAHTGTLTQNSAGVTALDVDIDAATLQVVYRDVSEAALDVRSSTGANSWKLTRDGDTLQVTNARDWWFGPWGGLDELDEAILTLPESLADSGMHASLDLDAGSIRTDGAFGTLELELSAGSIDVAGSADEVTVDASAGRVLLDLADVRSARLELSAGSIEGQLTGSVPDEVTAQVSAGRISLGLPAGQYAVGSDVSAGSFDNGLRVDPASTHRVSVNIAAGSVSLRENR